MGGQVPGRGGESEREAYVWRPLPEATGVSNPLFDSLLFLPGYEFSSNTYALVGGNGFGLIDAGNDYTAFVELAERGLGPEALRTLVITHGHVDHSAGVLELLTSYPRLGGEGGVEFVFHVDGPVPLKEAAREKGHRVREVGGGEVVEVAGFHLEVVATPGHTMDSICLYHRPTGTLFSGDTVLPEAVAAPDRGAGGSLPEYLASLRRLRSMDISHVLPGHGRPQVGDGALSVLETYEAVLLGVAGPEVGSWKEVARRFASLGYLEEVVYSARKWLEQHPEDHTTRELEAFSLTELGRYEEALAELDRILEAEPARVPALVGKGYALMATERYEESLDLFDRALALEPERREAQVYKGMALFLSGRQGEAAEIEAFREEFAARLGEELRKRSNG